MSFKERVARSAAWSAVQIAGNQVTSFFVFLILTRLLLPDQIGLVALAASFIELSAPLMRGGLPEALVQRDDSSETQADTCFWSTLIASLVFVALIVAAAPFVAALFQTPELAPILQVLSLTLPISALTATHEARLTRSFGFKLLAVRSLLANAVGGAVAVAMALLGFGVWSLVAQRIVASVVALFSVWLAYPWRPGFKLSRTEFVKLASFGMHMTAASFLATLNGRTVEFILGYFWGPAAVGYLRVATRCLDLVTNLTVNPITSVALPAFSRLQSDRPALERAFVRMTQASGLLTFPAYFGMGVIAADLVPLTFGRQWELSGELLSIMCLVALPITLQFFTWPALAAVGRADQASRGILVILLASVAITVAFAPFGVVAVAVGNVVRAHLTLPMSLWMVKRYVGLSLHRLLSSILLPFAGAVLMAGIVFAAGYPLAGLQPIPRIALMVAAGAVAYGLFVGVFARPLLRELTSIVRRKS